MCSFLDVRVLTDKPSGLSKGFGFVDFVDLKGAENALEILQDGIELDGRKVRFELAKSKAAMSTNCKLFVSNLPADSSENGLREIFLEALGSQVDFSIKMAVNHEDGMIM